MMARPMPSTVPDSPACSAMVAPWVALPKVLATSPRAATTPNWPKSRSEADEQEGDDRPVAPVVEPQGRPPGSDGPLILAPRPTFRLHAGPARSDRIPEHGETVRTERPTTSGTGHGPPSACGWPEKPHWPPPLCDLRVGSMAGWQPAATSRGAVRGSPRQHPQRLLPALWSRLVVVAVIVAVAIVAGSLTLAPAARPRGKFDGAVAVDPADFSPGACEALPPTKGDNGHTVFLDAGHGGIDPGAVGTTTSGASLSTRPPTRCPSSSMPPTSSVTRAIGSSCPARPTAPSPG